MNLTKHQIVPFNNYIREVYAKSQIYLHHTAGGPSGKQVFDIWQMDNTPVATCVSISADGTIVQGYGSQFWAYHLGLRTKHFKNLPYKQLDKTSIGIEICNYGYLVEKQGEYYNYVGGKVTNVCTLDRPYKGYTHWQNYTDEQIFSVRELLLMWNERYGIDLTYHEDIWQVTDRALKGERGVFTHNSVRADKADVYPHPKLITMLQNL